MHEDSEEVDLEKLALAKCIFSFQLLESYCLEELHQVMQGIAHLPPEDAAILSGMTGVQEAETKELIRKNQVFVEGILRCHPPLGPCPDLETFTTKNLESLSKVKSTMVQFIRDWSDYGQTERANCYQPLIDAMLKYVPLYPETESNTRSRVLVPGCGLGRLAFEVIQQGYSCQGNEFSYHMLLAANYILNEVPASKYHTIYPYVVKYQNRTKADDQFRGFEIPDVAPMTAVDQIADNQEFGICAGEFVDVYSKEFEEWHAVLTCFFIDTALNIYCYIDTLAILLKPGGVWANLGPLLWHFSQNPKFVSIDLSWQEIRPYILKYFTIVEEDLRTTHYSSDSCLQSGILYDCLYFVAIRRSDIDLSQLDVKDHYGS